MAFINNRYKICNENSNNLETGKLQKIKDLKLDSFAYIKLLDDNNKYLRNKEFISNLIDETTMILSIKGRFAKILEVDFYDSYKYIISEYFEGIKLSEAVNKYKLEVNDILFIAKQLIESMKSCDDVNLYHGGLTLDNILVDENYNIKIYDLGIVKANNGISLRLADDISCLCPHQININYTDRESDFFAIGVILYYCLFKKMPYEKGITERQMLKNIDKGIDWNNTKVDDLNSGLVAIIKKLLERKEKYKSYDEILIDITKLIYSKHEEINNPVYVDMPTKKNSKSSFAVKIISIIMVIIIFMMIILQL